MIARVEEADVDRAALCLLHRGRSAISRVDGLGIGARGLHIGIQDDTPLQRADVFGLAVTVPHG